MFQTRVDGEKASSGEAGRACWGLGYGTVSSRGQASGSSGFSADNVVSLDDGGHAHARTAILNSGFDAQNSSQSVYQHFCTLCYIRGQSEDQVEPRPRLRILIHYEVKTSSGNVTGLGLLRINDLIGGDSNKNRQSQIIAPICATLSNAPHFAYTSRTNRLAAFPSLD